VGIEGVLGGRETYLSEEEETVLGRTDSATVRVLDGKVSRVHCKISFDGGFYVVQDMGSSNGTWLNGRKVERAILFEGDRLVVGDQTFKFQLEAEIDEHTTGLEFEDSDEAEFATEVKEKAPSQASASDLLGMNVGQETAIMPSEVESDLAHICRVINLVNGEQNLDRLFTIIMDNVMAVSGADRGYLVVGTKPGGVIVPMISRNRKGIPATARGSFSRSIVRECYEGGYAILRADPLHDASRRSDSIITQNIQSVICVPMQCEEGVVGVIYVDKLSGSQRFTKGHLRVLTAIGSQSGIAIRRAQLTEQVEMLLNDCMRMMVKTVETKDEYTRSHSERVTDVAMHLGVLCGLGREELRVLRLAGLLHDIGKVAVDARILKKPTTLTDSEFRDIRLHPVNSANIVATIDNADRIVRAVRHHHERWDGAGYPDGLAGDAIPLKARILSIADAFDSMVAGRCYREAMPIDKIIEEFQNGRGTQFAPELVDKFVEALRTDSDFRRKIKIIYRKEGTDEELMASKPAPQQPTKKGHASPTKA